LALGITASGIPFGGPRGCLTDIFFLIASFDEAIHLKILARLSRLIQVEAFVESIRSASSVDQIWQLIADAEELI
jgi:PTS system nitrogen regulatory IIA component